jgi:hypothetical protein
MVKGAGRTAAVGKKAPSVRVCKRTASQVRQTAAPAVLELYLPCNDAGVGRRYGDEEGRAGCRGAEGAISAGMQTHRCAEKACGVLAGSSSIWVVLPLQNGAWAGGGRNLVFKGEAGDAEG